MSGDPRQIKAQMRRHWDDVAPAWMKWRPVVEPSLAPVSELLLDMARVAPGQWVLDVASGGGDVALAAARRVGPQGKVVGIDLAKRMVALADARARREGFANVSFQELDAEDLGAGPVESYEAAVTRFGLSFLPQPELALMGLYRVLLRGAWMACASWSAPDKVPFLSVAGRAVAEFVGRALPAPDAPGPFALATPGVLEQAMSSAGFVQIHAERPTVVIELPSAQAYVEMLREASSLGSIVAETATVGADTVWQAVADAAAAYAGPDGKLTFVCHVVCVAGKKP
jgi:enediyne biosynthesis protein CalE5